MTIFKHQSNTYLKLGHFDLAKTLGISQELNACAVKSLMLVLFPCINRFRGRLWKVITIDEVIIEDDFCFKRRRHEPTLSSPYEDTDRSC